MSNEDSKNSEEVSVDFSNPADEIVSVGDENLTPENLVSGEREVLSDDSQNSSIESELEKTQSSLLYLRAEFENYKRNAIKERSDLLRFGSERLAVDLLNVLDIFERALEGEVSAETFDSFKQGVEMTAHELKETLKRHGIQEIPSMGEAFDPNSHEALSSEPTDKTPEGHITQVYKKPYKLHDKIIRHGQVVVATALPAEEKE